MSRTLLYCIIFIEGFCSLGAEVIALRRLVPHVGSAILITAPTIGLFLLALALGYAQGGRIEHDFRKTVTRNFLLAALLAGVGLASLSIDALFTHLHAAPLAYLCFVGGILCPLAWLLGQTVPILTNLMPESRMGEASGQALYWSTLGSFLGSLALSLGLMQWLGVSAAVIACSLGLLIGALLLERRWPQWLGAGLIAVASLATNLAPGSTIETAYADYRVKPVELPGQRQAQAFLVNQSVASLLDRSEPAHYTRYIQYLRRVLLEDMAFKGRDILVLGAGGFTLSHREPLNRYTYVDIDPAIRHIAERDFLGEAIRGEFIVDDARRFVARSDRRFDALVVDVYSSHMAIPSHLITQEFWRDTRRILKPDGILLANLILDGRLESPYARNLLSTIESIYGRCGISVLHPDKPLANVEVSCFASSQSEATQIYRDELNRADFDRLR